MPLNTNIHFHTLVAEGVFEEQEDGTQGFVPAPMPPTDVEVARLLASVRRRIVRLVRRYGIDLEGALDDDQTATRSRSITRRLPIRRHSAAQGSPQ
jgi:hypothetical protein